ncbi:MAG: hypothetical protein HC936_17875 [Leptolyngbyaceae cyanobacterium SU_3_3]|nr:hypothetical protein [Leptolyngbyaceae cyanobacterium SU_3_3]
MQWNEGEQLVIEANPTYYGQSPKIKRVVFLLYSRGCSICCGKGRVYSRCKNSSNLGGTTCCRNAASSN